MTAETHDIPGLAKYLPARRPVYPKGQCRECGVKLEGYHLEPDYKFWQCDTCDACMDKWEVDDDD